MSALALYPIAAVLTLILSPTVALFHPIRRVPALLHLPPPPPPQNAAPAKQGVDTTVGFGARALVHALASLLWGPAPDPTKTQTHRAPSSPSPSPETRVEECPPAAVDAAARQNTRIDGVHDPAQDEVQVRPDTPPPAPAPPPTRALVVPVPVPTPAPAPLQPSSTTTTSSHRVHARIINPRLPPGAEPTPYVDVDVRISWEDIWPASSPALHAYNPNPNPDALATRVVCHYLPPAPSKAQMHARALQPLSCRASVSETRKQHHPDPDPDPVALAPDIADALDIFVRADEDELICALQALSLESLSTRGKGKRGRRQASEAPAPASVVPVPVPMVEPWRLDWF